MTKSALHRFWDELQRRRVVRVAVIYIAGAWVAAQAAELIVQAFAIELYLRYVIAALIVGLPVALVLAWIFDITPSGIQRTPERAEVQSRAPDDSIAVLPFTNLGGDAENEYLSDGLSEEIRNQLAKTPGLRVAARTSSFAFKGRHDDVREIGRRLNVANLLEGGVRKLADGVRIDVQLVNAVNGYQVWSENFERRLDDIFRLQSEIAEAVIAAVSPRLIARPRVSAAPGPRNFEAYNLYLLGRHFFHKRTETALVRAVECFEQAIALDHHYALAYSGLADAYSLLSTGYYGNMQALHSISHALPAAEQALALAPDLAEAHASLGLIFENQGKLDEAKRELERAVSLNPGYTMAHVWLGLTLTAQGRYREAEASNREAFTLDPLSPIVNVNVGFDALRRGDRDEAVARFTAAIEIDPAFPVSYSGMARLNATRGELEEARQWIDQAIERAPARAFYLARKGLLLLQLGRVDAATEAITLARSRSPDNLFDAELVIALHMVRGDQDKLQQIAGQPGTRTYTAAQRAQTEIALGNHSTARALYAQSTANVRQEIDDVINDDWIWRLPHAVNRAHLRMQVDHAEGSAEIERLLATLAQVWAQKIVNVDTLYLAASAHAVLGQREQALTQLEQAIERGWRHAWWARCDWNMKSLDDDARYQQLLARG